MHTSRGNPFNVQDGYRRGGWRLRTGFARCNLDYDRHVVARVVIKYQDHSLKLSAARLSKRQIPEGSCGYREWAFRSLNLAGIMSLVEPQKERVEHVFQLVRRRPSYDIVQLVLVYGDTMGA